jgi:hypothetical protein
LPLHVDISGCHDLFQVGTATKSRPITGDDDDPAVGVGFETLQGSEQDRGCLWTQRISLLGSIKDNATDTVTNVNQNLRSVIDSRLW